MMKFSIKRRFDVLLGLLCLNFAYTLPDNFVIHGYIKGLKNGTVYLGHDYNENQILDSALVTNNEFTFTGSTPEPLQYYLKFPGPEGRQMPLFVENSSITITADIDSIANAHIAGSISENVVEAYLKGYSRITTLRMDYDHFCDSLYKVNKYQTDPSIKAMVKAERIKIDKSDFDFHQNFIRQHKGSIVCAYLINTHYQIRENQPDKAYTLFSLLDESVKQSYYGRKVAKILAVDTRSALGSFPDFEMSDVNGEFVKLSTFRGKYVLVDFWASWCAPCRKENPNILVNYHIYHDKGLEIVGISLDRNKADWIKAIQKDALPWTQLSDLKEWSNAAVIKFGIKTIPSNFLLDKSGMVVAKDLKEDELSEKLKNIFQ